MMPSLAEIRADHDSFYSLQRKEEEAKQIIQEDYEIFLEEKLQLKNLNAIQKNAKKEDLLQKWEHSEDPRIQDWLLIFLHDFGKHQEFFEKVKPKILNNENVPYRQNKTWLEFAGFGFSDYADDAGNYDVFNLLFDFLHQNFDLDEFSGGLTKRLLTTRFNFLFDCEKWHEAIKIGEWAMQHDARISTKMDKIQKKLKKLEKNTTPARATEHTETMSQ